MSNYPNYTPLYHAPTHVYAGILLLPELAYRMSLGTISGAVYLPSVPGVKTLPFTEGKVDEGSCRASSGLWVRYIRIRASSAAYKINIRFVMMKKGGRERTYAIFSHPQ